MFPLDRILVYHFEDVVFRVVKVNVIHMERDLGNIIPDEVNALIYEPECLTVPDIERRCVDKVQLVDDFLDFYI